MGFYYVLLYSIRKIMIIISKILFTDNQKNYRKFPQEVFRDYNIIK